MAIVDMRTALNLPEEQGDQAFFAVYDGHNGDSTSELLSRRLHHVLVAEQSFQTAVETALTNACEKTDEECQDMNIKDSQFSGSTANIVLIRKDATHNDGNLVYCANVGDCRCVLSRRGKAIELSMDHKPSRPDEQARIEAAGGWVHNNRIHGVLSVSRAFGDVEHKRLKTKSWEKEFVSDPLIATPEIQSERLGEDDEFMIIACDGLWDVMTSQQAVNFVRRRLWTHKDIERAADEIIAKSMELNTVDNVSVCIICLNQTGEES